MPRIVCLLLFAFSFVYALSQVSDKHPSTLGVHFTLSDFKNSFPSNKVEKMNAGLAISYLSGISEHFDWEVTLNASFTDSISEQATSNRKKALLLQGDFALRIRSLRVNRSLQPYLLTGWGVSHFKERLGNYVLLGPSIEINYRDVYFIVTAQYRVSLSNTVSNHYYYSIGIAGLLSKAKKKNAVINAPAVQQLFIKDSDGDGIIDSLDACPVEPGVAKFNGCPDRDNDGIPDKDDNCPTIYGLEKYKGCPIPDRDKDGINDEEDQCPEVPGVVKYYGCPVPDSDGDGVNDDEDSCINVRGVKENKGCPLVSKDITQKIDLAAKNIYFKTGSYELLSQSFTPLNEVVSILKENKTLYLIVEGHTDNEGTEKANEVLSKNRAAAVVFYLESKGIDGGRLSAIGYGMKKPIASNSTSEGRANNRRVEMKAIVQPR